MIAAFLVALETSPCASAQTQSDLDVCWASQAKQADAALNVSYKKLQDGLTAMGVDPKPLVPPQMAWIAARDTTCTFEESLYEGGSIAPMIYSECVDRMTRARTQRLDDVLAVVRSGGKAPAAAAATPSIDKELNRVYGLMMKQQLTSTQREALIKSEVAWIAYRDKACAFEGGACVDQLENERTQELEAGWIGEQFW
jgi:uncharacterized protein YecT (DUF1311 family)